MSTKPILIEYILNQVRNIDTLEQIADRLNLNSAVETQRLLDTIATERLLIRLGRDDQTPMPKLEVNDPELLHRYRRLVHDELDRPPNAYIQAAIWRVANETDHLDQVARRFPRFLRLNTPCSSIVVIPCDDRDVYLDPIKEQWPPTDPYQFLLDDQRLMLRLNELLAMIGESGQRSADYMSDVVDRCVRRSRNRYDFLNRFDSMVIDELRIRRSLQT